MLFIFVVVNQMLVQRGVELHELTRVFYSIFFDEDNKPFWQVQLLQVLPWNSYDEGHKALLRRLEEMVRQVWHIHIAPFQRQDHSHESFDDEGSQIAIVWSEDYLLFLKDSRQDLPKGRSAEG